MPTKRLLRNLTLHQQSGSEQRLARDAGFELSAAPEGVTVYSGPEGLREACKHLVAKLSEVRDRGEAALLGGHTGVWVAAALEIAMAGGKLPDLYYFDTRRVRDESGRWLFIPEGLVRIAVPGDS